MVDKYDLQLFQNELRGPLFIPNSNLSTRSKYVSKVDSCSRCFKHSASKYSEGNYNVSIFNKAKSINIAKNYKSQNINQDEVQEQTKFQLQQFPVSKLKQMKNLDSMRDKQYIYLNNVLLGQRMRHNYKETNRSLLFNSTRPTSTVGRGTTRNEKTKSNILGSANKSGIVREILIENDLDKDCLSKSAHKSILTQNTQKQQFEWDEFQSTFPEEARWINFSQQTWLKRKVGKKDKSKKDMLGSHESDKSQSNNQHRIRRQSLSSNNKQTLKFHDQNETIFQLDQNSEEHYEQNEEIVLVQNFKDQPDVVLNYLLNGQKFCPEEEEILSKWIYTLPQEARMEIERDKKYFPIPRNIDQTSIRKGLDKLYGVGKQRRLRPGEEALLLETINNYLEESLKNTQHLTYSVQFVLNHILKQAGLEEILDFPLCLKQLECHWKLMATCFRYGGNPIIHSKKLEKSIQVAQARGHFLDLTRKDNPLSIIMTNNKFQFNSKLSRL